MRPPQGNYGVGTKANWENKHHLLNLLLIWTFSFLLWLPLVAYKQGEWGWGSRERDSGLRGGGTRTSLRGFGFAPGMTGRKLV